MNWRPYPNYEARYEVSDTGLVRRKDGHLLGQWLSRQGYCRVRLSSPRKDALVHRAVAGAFIPNPHRLPVVNHLDANRANNTIENLEWCTQWHNLDHARKMGRMQLDFWKGKRTPCAILTDEEVAEIRRRYAAGNISWEALGREYEISKRSIGRIVRGESYV